VTPTPHDWLTISLALGFSETPAVDRCHPLLEAGLDPVTTRKLDETGLARLGVRKAARTRLTSGAAASQAEELLARARARSYTFRGAPDWPRLLDGLVNAPVFLWYRGSLAALRGELAIAIVGARHPTPYGIHACRDFAGALARVGTTVVSGLARGIGQVAHETTLPGPTVAVLGSGLDEVYPRENAALADQIVAAGGCLVSEYPPDYRAHPGTFPRRNRIIAGLTHGTLVIEAGRRSGALITADWANACGRPVWAVPGPYTSPLSEGCHRLIADGAGPASSPAALLLELGVSWLPIAPETALSGSNEQAILDALARNPAPADAIATDLGLGLDDVLLGLQRLELEGLIECRVGGMYFRL